MRDLANLIAANAAAAGREAGHALNDYFDTVDADRPEPALLARYKAIEAAQSEEIDRLCNRDGVQHITESPEADLAFLAFNRAFNVARKEG